jgi:hypothetical protein
MSIPVGAAPVNAGDLAFRPSVRTALGKGLGSMRSARSVARTNGVDGGPAPAQTLMGRVQRTWVTMWGWWGSSPTDDAGCGVGRGFSATGHPFARRCGHGAVRWQHARSIKRATTPLARGS